MRKKKNKAAKAKTGTAGKQRKTSASETAIASIRELLCELLERPDTPSDLIGKIFSLLDILDIACSEMRQHLDDLLRSKYGSTSEKKSKAALANLLANGGPDIPGHVADAYKPTAGDEGGERTSSNATGSPDRSDRSDPSNRPKPRKKRTGGGRNASIPKEVPREIKVVDVPEADKVCSCCSEQKTRVGVETTEQLHYIPAQLKVLRTEYPKYACSYCRGDKVVMAPRQTRPTIDDGLATFSLLAHIVASKFADHLPLYRQRKIFGRMGLPLPESTMGKWVADCADALLPIASTIGDMALKSHVLQTDDTGLRVLDKESEKGTARGHLWGYLGDGQWFYYHYTPDWKADDTQEFLKDRVGWLVADGYAGYAKLFKDDGTGCIEVACWAHTRRYFEKASTQEARAAVALHYIGKLYVIERRAKEEGLDAEATKALRVKEATPILEDLKIWVDSLEGRVTPKSALGKAVTYITNQWTALRRYLEDGALPIDNTAVERAHRGTAVGRRNWLFAGSHQAAERTATLYSVVNTCLICGVDPEAYIADVLRLMQERGTAANFDNLLPQAWGARKKAEENAKA